MYIRFICRLINWIIIKSRWQFSVSIISLILRREISLTWNSFYWKEVRFFTWNFFILWTIQRIWNRALSWLPNISLYKGRAFWNLLYGPMKFVVSMLLNLNIFLGHWRHRKFIFWYRRLRASYLRILSWWQIEFVFSSFNTL